MKYEMKLVMELLNQSANIGIVKLDDTARENMTPFYLFSKYRITY